MAFTVTERRPYVAPVELQHPETMHFEHSKNFAGAVYNYNRSGGRYVEIKITPELADQIEGRPGRPGYMVHWTKANEKYPVPEPFLKCYVGYQFRAPKICTVKPGTGSITMEYNESNLYLLDSMRWADIEYMKVTPSGKEPDNNGVWRFTPYIYEMYIAPYEDSYNARYHSAPADQAQ